MSDTTSNATDCAIWEKAREIAVAVITGINGPRPELSFGPAGEGPRTADCGITEQQFYAYFGATDRQRVWDRRVRLLTQALATEVRCIEDRGVAMRVAA